MNTRTLAGLAVVVAGVVAGFYSAMTSWSGYVFIDSSVLKARNPAAIRKVFDFSHLEGSALKVASQKRLVSDARIVNEADGVGVELGHFVTRAGDGRKDFACQVYDRIVLTFKAEGVAVSGEKPSMQIESPCQVAVDINRMAPIWIPVARILGERPNDMELSYPELNGTSFRFEHLGAQWPQTWGLASIRLYNESSPGREIVIGEEDIGETRGMPLILHWDSPLNQ